jgi:hypothetical protein
MRSTDPAALTAAERLAEIGSILAAGFLRLVAAEGKARAQPRNSQVRLAAVGAGEAPCGSRVLSPQSLEHTA